jgi:hypothetical protein
MIDPAGLWFAVDVGRSRHPRAQLTELDRVHRLLDLVDDHLGELGPLLAGEALPFGGQSPGSVPGRPATSSAIPAGAAPQSCSAEPLGIRSHS